MYTTDQYEGMIAETITMPGHNDETIKAYFARPIGSGPFPGIVLIHHYPGWDEWYRETTRRFAHHGYAAISPNLYERVGQGTPEDVAAKVRAQGGIPDDAAVGDITGAANYLRSLPNSSGKVGVFGTCSGGRHAFLTACRGNAFDAVVECWGGNIVMPAERLSEKYPVAPIDLTSDLSAPLLGLFGNLDRSPTPEEVDMHEAALKEHGKDYEFHRYEDAGHGFFYYHRTAYRPEQTMDAWNKIWAFLDKHIG